ncbi:MAG: transposase [Kiritimatiellales bacterium]
MTLLHPPGPRTRQQLSRKDETRELAWTLELIPVVPLHPNRKNPWEQDKIIYKKRNEVERLIRQVKSCRRVFTQYDKLDIMCMGFIVFAFTVEFLRPC